MAVRCSHRGNDSWERGGSPPLPPRQPYLWQQKALSSFVHTCVEEKDINYKPVIVLLEVGSLQCLQYGHSRGGSEVDHQDYPGVLCSSHPGQRRSLSLGQATLQLTRMFKTFQWTVFPQL